jgi:hypothetical protein
VFCSPFAKKKDTDILFKLKGEIIVTKVKSIYPVSNPAHQPTKQATTTTMRF